MKDKLEGIENICGIEVDLSKIENAHLERIIRDRLCVRSLRGEFLFHGHKEGYQEEGKHKEKYSDKTHTDKHRDDYKRPTHHDTPSSISIGSQSGHTDNHGSKEASGYSAHTDKWE